jgi:hypothetical protein
MIDVILALDFLHVFPNKPFIIDKAELRKAVKFLLYCLVMVIYMILVVRIIAFFEFQL